MEMKVTLDSHGSKGTWKRGDIIVNFPGFPCFDYLEGSEIIDCTHAMSASKTIIKFGENTLQPGVEKTLYLGPSTVVVRRK